MKEAMKFAIGTAVMIAVAFAVTAASAKPMPGGKPHPHPHHHWHGGSFIAIGGDYPADCWMVKRYTPTGRPYLVEVCG